jgi:hypothetical protein
LPVTKLGLERDGFRGNNLVILLDVARVDRLGRKLRGRETHGFLMP